MKPAPFLLERYFAQHEFNARHLLSSSDCESIALGELLALEPETREKLDNLWLGYSESLGNPILREEIARLYKTASAGDVLVHVGAQEAILGLMSTLLSPGDQVITQFPCYQSAESLPQALGCQVARWLPSKEFPWEWDVNTLLEAITPQTKLIVINNPHNPTGYLMPHSDYLDVLREAQKQGIYVLSDEVYMGLEYNPVDRLPPACDLYERAISLGVLSKSYGLAGLRVGWVATHDSAVFENMAAFKDYTSICNSTPNEFLATMALRHGERLIQRNRNLTQKNLALLEVFFKRHADRFAWSTPHAGCIAFPSVKNGSAEVLCASALEKAGVLLVPGTKFGYGDRHFRVGFGRKTLPEALQAFEGFCDG